MWDLTLPGGRCAPSWPEASLKAGFCQKPSSTATVDMKPRLWGSPSPGVYSWTPPSAGAGLPWVLKNSLLSEFTHSSSHPATMLPEGWPPIWDKHGGTQLDVLNVAYGPTVPLPLIYPRKMSAMFTERTFKKTVRSNGPKLLRIQESTKKRSESIVI